MTAEGPLRVSVIVPTKNRSAMLQRALASVRALEGPDLDIELIVADNGSTDDTAAVAHAFGAQLILARTPGAAAARNAGIRAATGEYIAFLDDDDVWLPGHLRPHLELLRARPDLAGAIGQVLNCDYSLSSRSRPWPVGLSLNGDLFAAFLGLCPQIGATVVRASVRESVGYLDEALFGDEDWDWHLRLALRHGVGFIEAPCVLFRTRSPGSRDGLEWVRLKFNRRVFWRNVRRGARRRPSAARVARLFLLHNGAFADGFLQSAVVQVAADSLTGARLSLMRALASSPLHVLWVSVRDGRVRNALRRCGRLGL